MSGAAAATRAPHWALVYGALLGVAIGNAAYNVVTKWVLSGKHKADPLCFSLLRDVLAFPILEAGALCVDGVRLPTRRDLPLLALLGLLGMFGNQFLFIYGLSDKSVSATLAAVTSQTQPVFGALFAIAARQVKASWLLALGVLLAFGGSAVMARVWSSEVQSGEEMLHLGSLLLGAACMAGYYVVQAPVLRRIPPLTLTAWSYFFGAAWMVRRLLLPSPILPSRVAHATHACVHCDLHAKSHTVRQSDTSGLLLARFWLP